MPGFDATGPRGMGSMTGGMRGWCSPWSRNVPRTGFRPRFGWGRGRGGRPGRMGWAAGAPGWFSSGPVVPGTPAFSGDQELEFLRNQAAALKDELNDIENRVKELASRQ